ncbi:type II CRISPR-associated endonuclease Cas1 [Campylobacter jejuni]|uniref:type II CRISPR-associated endonuclease Cas1 n=1 Tax=Campylobacter jejuni TaxID=197 RepID=UPI0013AB8AB5|nr:type II CRISPR-associated endonuclease Cas1 [Campylobacter jejuni]EAJ3056169.1 type II CRISPR-associated endonuclease Cas1 [Campylobacter jejuni]EDP3557041.1 type II CRISPR-associated endonuclease Cas1 [Campylobacter jejuni]EGA4756242.1 type II CRISPR-associated endonuclease Cas1 [Campylobacter jejuni]EHV0366683.1 type II CRISPR-associated endonuclease Cas1 [Campylobacter jejuni]
MSYDEAFKTLLISSNAKLNLELNHLVIKQDENIAKLFLKDINIIILESLQASLSSALFNAFAKHKIILLTCDETHSINGIFTPFLGHFQSAKIAKEQINVSAQKKAILWQKIIKNKILNQAFVLKKHNKIEQSNELCFENSALNYGYAIIRACIIRAVCISGLLPWLGIKHDNIYNSFALCDDLIEVFRASVDDCVLKLKGESEFLSKDDKRALIGNLQSKINFDGQNYPLNRAINHYVANFKNALLYEDELKIVKFDD